MSYVSTNLMGGLGNQMFQIAAGIALADKLQREAKFHLHAFVPMQGNTPDLYKDNIFRYVKFDRPVIEEPAFPFLNNEETFFDKFQVDMYQSVDPVILNGYFQSDRFFTNQADYIKGIFAPPYESKILLEEKFPEIKSEKTLSLHVRRGDYINIRHVLPVLHESYFIKTVERNFPEYDKMFIFSDSREWVEENLKFPNSVFVDGLADYEEMWLMSMCKHNIISNSSFSWWASYLNKNPEKQVYSPDVWFGREAPKQVCSIYRDDMTLVKMRNNEGFLYA